MTETATETTTREYTIPASYVPAQQAKLDKANRRAARAGITERYSMTVELFTRTEKNEWGIERSYPMATVTILGDLLKVQGYKFAATIDWSLGTPLIRRNASLPEDMVVTAPADKLCQHCHTDRDRKDTYLVIDEATGELVQVGRNCLAAYCGIQPGWVSTTTDIDSDFMDIGWGHSDGFAPIKPETLLAIGYVIVEVDGQYKPKAFEQNSTAASVWLVIGEDVDKKCVDYHRQKNLRAHVAASYDAQLDRARKTLEWAKALEPGTNDFLYNLKVIADAEYVGSRHVNLCLAAIPAYDRETIKIAEKAQRGPAPTGKGITVTGTIESAFEREGDYGLQYKMWVRLENGSRIYSTIPANLIDQLREERLAADDYTPLGVVVMNGWTAEFIANVEAARDDETTGFANRPRKAKVISKEVAS